MDYSVLIPAGIGAAATLFVTGLNARNTSKNDHRKWIKEHRLEAYVRFEAAERAVRAQFGRYYEQNPDAPSRIGEFPPELRDLMLERARAVSEVAMLASPAVEEAAKAYDQAVEDFVLDRGSKPRQDRLTELEVSFVARARKDIHGR